MRAETIETAIPPSFMESMPDGLSQVSGAIF
jgi:hypothetical protein